MLIGGFECQGLSSHCAPPRPPACSHPSTLSLSLTCLSSFLAFAPGLEQLRNLQHLDVAYNLLEEHRVLSPLWLLAELRKVGLGCFKDLEASSVCPPAPPC